MSIPRKKKRLPKRVLALPDLEQSRQELAIYSDALFQADHNPIRPYRLSTFQYAHLGHAGLGQPLRLPELHGESEAAHVGAGLEHFVHRVRNGGASIHVDDRKRSSIPSPIDRARVGKSASSEESMGKLPSGGG